MCSRRNKPFLQALFFVVLVGALGYGFFLYNELSSKFQRSERQVRKYAKHQESLSAQLQVVYEHRARLEKSLQKEKSDHKQTKQILELKQHRFRRNFTRSRHEAMNRFNSLDTQYKMLKAQHDDVEREYNRLQQQHARLSSEHAEVREQMTVQLKALKEQKTSEISALEEQMKSMAAEMSSLKNQVETQKTMALKYKSLHHGLYQEKETQKLTLMNLRHQVNSQQKLLNEYVRRLNQKHAEDRSQGRQMQVHLDNKRENGLNQNNLNQENGQSRNILKQENGPNENILRPGISPSDVSDELPSANEQSTIPSSVIDQHQATAGDKEDLRGNRPDIEQENRDQPLRNRPLARDLGLAHTAMPLVTTPLGTVLPKKGGEGEVEQDPSVRKYLHQQPVRSAKGGKHASLEGHVDRRSGHQRVVRDVQRLGFHGKPIPKPVYLKDSEVSKNPEGNDDRDDDKTESEIEEAQLQQEGGDDVPDREKDVEIANANQRRQGAARAENDEQTRKQDPAQVIETEPNEKAVHPERAGGNHREYGDNEEQASDRNGEYERSRKRASRERSLKASDKE